MIEDLELSLKRAEMEKEEMDEPFAPGMDAGQSTPIPANYPETVVMFYRGLTIALSMFQNRSRSRSRCHRIM